MTNPNQASNGSPSATDKRRYQVSNRKPHTQFLHTSASVTADVYPINPNSITFVALNAVEYAYVKANYPDLTIN